MTRPADNAPPVPSDQHEGKGAGPRPDLVDVTLVTATSVALPATVKALQASMRQARFAEILLLSDQPPPPGTDPAISWRQIERLGSRSHYSRFMLRDLAEHIRTSHALCVQWDGFVLNGGAWDPKFLEFDYIGAVWPHVSDGYNVGNGGFSLRSRRLLDACRELPLGDNQEDVTICRRYRPRLELQGIRFPPESVARRFSFERTAPSGREFGFHGVFNLVRYLNRSEALELVRNLDPGMLARNEQLELLRWALARGQFRLAAAMLTRLVRSFALTSDAP